MSYDLMVFEPDAAPKDHEDFLAWVSRQTEWGEDHSYVDPALTTERLRAWLLDMAERFPAMNGLLATGDAAGEASLADYAIGEKFIYVSFAWSESELAYISTMRLAEKHGVGFFNVSSPFEEVWLPEDGVLALAHKKSPPGLFDRLKGLLHLDNR